MKVHELIEKLKQCHPDAIVEFECNDDWYCGEIRVVEPVVNGEYETKTVVLKCEQEGE